MSLVLPLVGGALCLLNFALSFLRVPLLRAHGQQPERNVSGIPLLGSALVAVALLLGLDSRLARLAAWALIVMDTGGLHWFALVLLHQALRRRRGEGA